MKQNGFNFALVIKFYKGDFTMKLKTFLFSVHYENKITVYIEDYEKDYKVVDIISMFCSSEAMESVIEKYGEWYVTFIDFETSSITISEN